MSTQTHFALVPTVLLLGTGNPELDAPALAALADEALLVAVHTTAPAQPLPFLEDQLTVADEPAAVLAAGRELARRHRVAGVVALQARFAEAAAELADELGLAGPDPEAVRSGRDRWQTRLRLNGAGVGPVPARLAADPAQAEQAAAELGLPVLLRSRDAALATGAQRVDRPEQLAAAFRRAGLGGEVVVEPLLDGELLTLRGALSLGEAQTWLAVHRPSAQPLDPEDELFAELAEFAGHAYAALGLDHGLTGLDVLLTDEGPRVVLADQLGGADLLGADLLGADLLGADLPNGGLPNGGLPQAARSAAGLAGAVIDLAVGLPPRPPLGLPAADRELAYR
ncbi:hypothetical protein C7C46_25660 [Streptomyces tateyamensis]|uniref:ATP-grasp domain-containing protein n=1 Tax=Streptomyces tateyamensis TaxID=565073 RepID=A0A2V4N316_9ACTN|nr:hypothetical protein [Streptomyces tateyamensis]PYC72357.1 hypothetical protein C7C46_25660 [Streptomyces tateyamensis]